MAWYAKRAGRASGQVLVDLLVAAWSLVWLVVAGKLWGAINALAQPAREITNQATLTAQSMREAGAQAGRVPGVGPQLQAPFDSAAQSLETLAASAREQVAAIEAVATVAGLLCFVIPFLVVLVIWLPRRIEYHRASAAAARLARTPAGKELLAVRALATLPLDRLAEAGADLAQRWRDGEATAIDSLANLEMRRLGLAEPYSRNGGQQQFV